MIFLALILSALYWVISALLTAIFFQGSNLIEENFDPGPHEVWSRLWVSFFILALGTYFQILITRRRKTEERLDKEHGLIPSVLDMVASLIVVFDSAGRIVRFNNACEKMSGYLF